MRVNARVILALLIAIGIARITSTYSIFNHTIDEAAHLACGMQWFGSSYTYDPKHTPIARVAIALLPYLDGMRSYNDPSFWREGVTLLSSRGRYWHDLTLARLGILPFFVLATVVIFVWSRRLYGAGAALLSAAMFTLQPVVLAHSGLATTDIGLTAFFLLAVYAFMRWLARPGWRTALGLGVATALAIATKLSTLAFLPATISGIVPLYLASRRAAASPGETVDPIRLKPLLGQAALVILAMTMVIWTCYRFSHVSIDQFSSAPARFADRALGPGSATAREVHALTATLQLPAPELYNGLRDLRDVNSEHVRSYLLGRIRPGGWWYFYPVALAVKTPVAVLLLAVIGAVSSLIGWYRTRAQWQRLVPLLSIIAILVVAAPSRLDIGVRHVMPIFAFLSMLAAAGAIALWRWRPTWPGDRPAVQRIFKAGPIAVSALLLWLIGSSAQAHPDYLAYFNAFAGRQPANILVISDLDWGQDLARLSIYLREQRVSHVSIAYENFFDGPALGLPDSVRLGCGQTAIGWIAVEERRARVYPECFEWLDAQPIQAYVGKSMRIYYLPETVSKR